MTQTLKPYPKTVIIEKFISNFYNETINNLKSNSTPVWKKHNSFTNYCVTLFLHLTAHRPVIDPFCYRKEINHTSRLALINDKTVKQNAEYRIVAFPKLACDQYEEYLKHLGALLVKLRKIKGKPRQIAEAIERILDYKTQITPQFFYLDENLNRTYSITPSKLQELLYTLTWFPDNINRHIVATTLLERTGKANWAMIQLGHLESCDHPFGIASDLVAQKELQEIGNEINSAMTDLGWKVIKSPNKNKPSTESRPIKTPGLAQFHNIHESKMLGPEIRKARRDAVNFKHRNIVEFVLVRYEHIKSYTQVTPEIFKQIQEDIQSETSKNNLSTNSSSFDILQMVSAKILQRSMEQLF